VRLGSLRGAASPTKGAKNAKEATANEAEEEQAHEDISIDPRLLDEDFKATLKEHEASVDNVERGLGMKRSAVSAKLNKFMRKILPPFRLLGGSQLCFFSAVACLLQHFGFASVIPLYPVT
jgi:hypothetical protein